MFSPTRSRGTARWAYGVRRLDKRMLGLFVLFCCLWGFLWSYEDATIKADLQSEELGESNLAGQTGDAAVPHPKVDLRAALPPTLRQAMAMRENHTLGRLTAPQSAQQEELGPSSVTVIFDGTFITEGTVREVNLVVAQLLAATAGIDLVIHDLDTFRYFRIEPTSGLVPIQAPPSSTAPQFHIRHSWPPDWSVPQRGRSSYRIQLQSWEFGSLPLSWLEPIKRNIDEIWVPSQFVKAAYVKSGVDPTKVVVVPHGVNLQLFNPQAQPYPFETPHPSSFVILFNGDLLPRKGADVLLRAFQSAFKPADDVCLVIHSTAYANGGEQLQRFVEIAARSGACVVYHPTRIPAADVPGLYTAASCIALPFRAEAFGLSVIEAMAAKVPVIVTSAGPALEYCDNSRCFMVGAAPADCMVPPCSENRICHFCDHNRRCWCEPTDQQPSWVEPNEDDLRKALQTVVLDKAEVRRRVANAYHFVKSNMTWQHHVLPLMKRRLRHAMYQRLLRQTSHRYRPSMPDET
eukprot:TRINITY_DN28039_c0_g1_i1.p1 TRINITY_DN28039_c0_g1~~TRINITY_DN28039_c0_g1_i1.p1  ORF type:complete len:518 (-),score=65.60 TRINITY_DN28039_c0_g1_i1:8-1561(-)